MAIAQYKIGEKVATRDAYGDALLELGERHTDIVCLDADLAKSTKSILFGKKFPDRFRYVGISEADMVSMAAGLARCGKVPFASSFASFVVNRALDQMRISVAYSQTNVKIVGSHGGIVTGEDGPTGQEIMDIAIMKNMPNFNVLVPADYYETVACTNAMYYNAGPFYMRTCREKTPILYESVPDFKLGEANVLQEGKDAAIIACGSLVGQAMKAASILKSQNISVSVLNCASIKPFDSKSVEKECSKGIVVSAEDGVIGGLGSSIAEIIAEKRIDCKLFRVGLNSTFAESGKAPDLLAKYEMDANAIVERVKKGLGEKK
ncbi:MAG TPA: transketolase C-terminal domain-containing protein [archaeon]|nr:transketolase C-terminal domain-containing protein [archaeon]